MVWRPPMIAFTVSCLIHCAGLGVHVWHPVQRHATIEAPPAFMILRSKTLSEVPQLWQAGLLIALVPHRSPR